MLQAAPNSDYMAMHPQNSFWLLTKQALSGSVSVDGQRDHLAELLLHLRAR